MFDYRTPQQKAKMRAVNAAAKLGIVNIDMSFQLSEEDQAKLTGKMNGQEDSFNVKLVAPVSGKAISLKESGDRAFAMKALGEGIAVVPEVKTIDLKAPIAGNVTSVSKSKHAYTIMSDDGVGVLVHVGIDTVELKGEGFDVKVDEDQNIKAGDVIASVDFKKIKDAGYKIPVVVTVVNTNEMKSVEPIAIGKDVTENEEIIDVKG